MENSKKELNLKEFCETLHDKHRIKQDIKEIKQCIGLLNSIINGGESHSDFSRKKVKEALDKIS